MPIRILECDHFAVRRRVLKAGVASLSVFAGAGLAQTTTAPFPKKPVTIVCPFAPGGIVDISSRRLANSLSTAWGVPVLVENKPGAGGNVGAGIVAHSRPDGHTLLLTLYDGLVIARASGAKLGFDPTAGLVPVSLVGSVETLFLVPAASPDKTLREFFERARANPGTVNFGSIGIGSSFHLALEQMTAATGTDIAHIPYKGGVPMFADILGGRIDGVLSSALFSISFIKAGKVRPIAAGGTTRCQLYPEVPTIAEAGYPGIEVPYGLGLFVARDTPAPIVAQLNRDMANALHAPAMKARFADEGVTVGTLTPDQFRERVEREVKVIDQVIKRNKLKLDVGSHVPTPESSHFA